MCLACWKNHRSLRRTSLDWRKVLGAVLTVFLLACSHSAPTVAQNKTAEPPPPEPVPHSREANDVGRFLAGLPGTEGSPFAELEQQPAWILHRRELDKAWSHIESKTLPAMRQFQGQELTTGPIQKSLVFYPFS